MKAIGYYGPLDIGYRYDARDGQYKVLDINPRIGATFRLFVGENGMDVARAMYLDLTGQEVVSMPAKEGRKWIVEDLDLVSSFRYCREGTLSFSDWVRSFRGIEEAAFMCKDDPLPVTAMIVSRFGEFIRRLLRAGLERFRGIGSGARRPSHQRRKRGTPPQEPAFDLINRRTGA
jgi:predicted ATP-grasp superfamily ATP-dependent carboligase